MKLKILVVDDDQVLLKVIAQLLKNDKYQVRTAQTGQACFDAIDLEKPDLLLLDVMLPDMNGVDICKKIKETPDLRQIYIILLSGIQVESESVAQGLDTGADGYLIKPLNNREFVARIEAAARIVVTEKTLYESEQKFLQLSQAVIQSPVSIVITDTDGKIEYGNPTVFQLTGYQPDELMGKNPKIFSSGETSREEYKQLWDTILVGNEWKGEFHNRKKNGELFWEAATISAIKNSNGQITHFLAVKEDITAKKISENELVRTKEMYQSLSIQFEAILDHIPALIFFKDLNNSFIRVNKYLAMAYNKEKTELEGKNLNEIYAEAEAEKYYKDDLSVIQSGVARLNIEEPWPTPAGLRWVSTSKIPFIDESSGEIKGVIGLSIDITDRKLAENELLDKNSELQKLNAERDKLYRVIAHDLRSPFNALLGFTQILETNLPRMSVNEATRMVENIRKSAKTFYALLDNLLDWTRLQNGAAQVNPEPFLLLPLFKEVEGIVEETALKKRISIEIEVPETLFLYADKHMISTILRNLIFNAIKFTFPGGAIKVTAQQNEDASVEIIVSDNGIGMSPEIIENLFKMDNKNNRKGTSGEISTGLGLIICKEFIERNQGKLEVSSEEGVGSNFRITFPNN